MLNDPKCTVTRFIAALELDFWTNRSSQFHDAAEVFINRCNTLRSLRLFGRAETTLSSVSSTSISSSLTILEISDSSHGRGPQSSIEAGKILDVIGNFSALEVLSLWIPPGVTLANDPVEPVYDRESLARKARRSLPRLRRLKLDVIWNVFIPWFLIPEPGILHIPVVEVMELNLGHFPLLVQEALLQSLLDLYSSTLKELVLPIFWGTLPALNLGRFTALRSILFEVDGTPDEDDDEDQLQKLIDIVRTCPNRSREDPLRVIITNEDIEPGAIEGVDWILDEEAASLL
ncbi:hypothetical protein PM082_022456 [Marasmius tenuissimus]|nr:hypothetical protein PM082_022456 [Marasmius tenuissimus]